MNSLPANSPFSLQDEAAYRHWREDKLQDYPASIDQLLVNIQNPHELSADEIQQLMALILKTNMAIYDTQAGQVREPAEDKHIVEDIGARFGLTHLDNNLYADEDAISSLTITSEKGEKGYIPYTNRPIAWHTDGYYNTGEQQVRAMVLHCVQPSAEGGRNQLLDHEIAYILLRDLNPDYIEALSRPDAMGIPANVTDGEEIRPAVSGPVFSVDAGGFLHMRYTARTRSISWSEDPLVQEARQALEGILKSDTPYHFEGRLEAGQGLLCNNVLHTRSAFEADSPRLLYRGRYFDRIKIS